MAEPLYNPVGNPTFRVGIFTVLSTIRIVRTSPVSLFLPVLTKSSETGGPAPSA